MISSCCFDLETSSLNANFGIVLCAVIKGSDKKKPVIIRGDKVDHDRWVHNRSDDSVTISNIVKELDKYDILIAHNGERFDIPFLRTRMARWNQGNFPDKKNFDPVLIARRKFRMSSNSLSSLASLIGAGEKDIVCGGVWLQASLDGNSEAMDQIVKHCVRDVEILEKVADAVKGYSRAFNSYGSGF